jgi:hypothetical protein
MAWTPALDPGDSYEYAMSTLVRPAHGVELWIKVGVTGRVRPDETGAHAARRIEQFVTDRLDEAVNEMLGKKK